MQNGFQNDAVTKYLRQYAEAEATLTLPGKHYEHSLVIPAFNEQHETLLKVWQNIKPDTSFLVILVVNSLIEDDPSASALVDALTGHQKTTQISDRVLLVENSGNDILIIDRYSSGNHIDKKQGVGLARKIGMDIAVTLASQGVVASNWLYTTDADVELPGNYFEVDSTDDDAALVHPFRHRADSGLTLPMQLYEISMLYYVAGLRWASSPYAYPTIGSTISCSVNRYASVRGFPKRNTGEDFYLLNKLRKTGEVRLADGEPILIAGRFSDRVPIGTGQALKTIHEMASPTEDFTLEHPECFARLKHFLKWLEAISAEQPEQLATGDPAIDEYLQQIGLTPHYERKRLQAPSTEIMQKHLHDWFDGLKTRQFIHHFRDQHFGRITTEELTSAPFLDQLGRKESDLDDINASLRAFIYHQPPL